MRYAINDKRLMQLDEVNSRVNANVEYITDQVQYGEKERWEIAKSRGDCEDYALAKMQVLRSFEWSKECLDMAICKTPEGVFHAVLVVHTTNGDYILDNNSEKVLHWDSTPYTWVERSVDGNFNNWVAIPAKGKSNE